MKILPIISNQLFSIRNVYQTKPVYEKSTVDSVLLRDTVSFSASKASGTPLKKLAEYGMPDMYTGKNMMSYGALSRMLKNGVFDMPLNQLVPILEKYKDTLHETEQEFLTIIKSVGEKQPHIKINEALKQIFSEYQKKLLAIQKPIFYKIILKAAEMPKNYFDDFMDLMKYTNQKIEKDETTAHFSEKEFIYRLQQAAKQIKVKKRHTEVSAINKLIREAKILFGPQIEEKKKFGKGIAAKKLKMDYQMQPEIFKKNTKNIQYLMDMFENSYLKKNKDIRNIFDITYAKIYGTPIKEPFKRQEFIYDLKNIVKFLKDKKLEAEIIKDAHQLPTSSENVSAFIVKHVNDTPEKIGYYLFKGSLCSIEHIEPRVPPVNENTQTITKIKKKKKKKSGNNIAGRNHINNYGLSSAYINTLRSNIPFDEWIRQNPQAYDTCQKYVNRLVELYNAGKFKKVGLDRSYIQNFIDKVRKLSPEERPMNLYAIGLDK